MESTRLFQLAMSDHQFGSDAVPGPTSCHTQQTSTPSHSTSEYQQEYLTDDCTRAKIRLMYMDLYIIPFCPPVPAPEGTKFDCAFLRCCDKFSNIQELLAHMKTCPEYASGEYKFQDCRSYEKFSMPKNSCSLAREGASQALKRLGSSVRRSLSGRSPRGSPPTTGSEKRKRETPRSPWEDQEPDIPGYTPELAYRGGHDSFENRAELTTDAPEQEAPPKETQKLAKLPREGSESVQQPLAPSDSRIFKKIATSSAPVHAPTAVKPLLLNHSMCTSNWGSCSSGSYCPVSAYSSSSSMSGALVAAGNPNESGSNMMEPERMCDSPIPMDDNYALRFHQDQELPEMPGNSVFPFELDGRCHGFDTNLPEHPQAMEQSSCNADPRDLSHAAGGTPHYSHAPPLYYPYAASVTQEPHIDSFAEDFPPPLPSRTVSQDSNTPSFDSGYVSDPRQSQFSVHRTPSPLSPVDAGEYSIPSPQSTVSYEGDGSHPSSPQVAIAKVCPICGHKPRGKPELYRQYLNKHMKRHKDEWFKCPFCSTVRKNRKDNLGPHIKDIHQEEYDDIGEVMKRIHAVAGKDIQRGASRGLKGRRLQRYVGRAP
ncbi:putative zinc finger C2H2-like protein [Zalerion maritima]|uniref:Zinc finger C2H2-like protein n=1 Tax=Zalerion maritima TaxID=339359 RepID=A0AAD5WME7_9PEZI|nr:putative zinc finger C2H2-like protein [Zalerion maritima]